MVSTEYFIFKDNGTVKTSQSTLGAMLTLAKEHCCPQLVSPVQQQRPGAT